jgi:hypothetical protein
MYHGPPGAWIGAQEARMFDYVKDQGMASQRRGKLYGLMFVIVLILALALAYVF